MAEDFDPREYLQDFLTEAGEHLATLDDLLLEAERLVRAKEALEGELVNGLFRSAHTLKGMAGMLGFQAYQQLTHEAEQVLDQVRSGQRQLQPAELAVFFDVVDALKRLSARIASEGDEGSEDVRAAHEAIAKVARGEAVGAAEALNLLERVDPYDQMAILVEVAKGQALYNVRVDLALATQEVGWPEWHAGLGRMGQVQGIWNEEGEALAPAAVEEGSGAVWLLYLTPADRQSVLDATGVPEEDLLPAPLPWQEQVPTAEPPPSAPAQGGEAPKVEAPAAVAGPPGAGEASQQRMDKAEAKSKGSAVERATSIRVETELLDRLMELVGELVIHHTRLAQLVGEASALAQVADLEGQRSRLARVASELDEALQFVGRTSDELQEQTMQVRMVQVGTLFNRFPRIVRDLARECGKAARLDIEGATTKLDKTVIEQLGDPLVHLLRNAIDHGLEAPASRLESGKLPEGVITLGAQQQGHHILITVSDDGQGISRSRVLAKARERGLVGPHETPSDQEVLHLIFRPGFSTAETVTNLSGRGVGMDVVQSNIQRLGGSVSVHSEPGEGTRFLVKLPLTLAITKALLVLVGGQTYAIPLASVEESLRLAQEEIRTLHEREIVLVRGQVLPLFRMHHLFDLGQAKASAHQAVVVVAHGEQRLALAVDELLGQQDVVVKALGNFLGQIQGIGGATILGDGHVALILDVGTLVQRHGASEGLPAVVRSASKAIPAAPPPEAQDEASA